jgi:hypothetical protein
VVIGTKLDRELFTRTLMGDIGLLLSLPSGEELIRLDVVRVMEHHAAEHHLGMYFEYIH